jgi:hypothetical protein
MMPFVRVIEHHRTILVRAAGLAPCWYMVEWLRPPYAGHGAYHRPVWLGLN